MCDTPFRLTPARFLCPGASEAGTEAPPTPAHVIRHKLRYIQQEILLDLHPGGWRVMDYWLSMMVLIGALWIRVYLHTLGQWFLLYALGVPVFNFSVSVSFCRRGAGDKKAPERDRRQEFLP